MVVSDVAVIGAGAAGMLCAALAGQRGLRVTLIDHAEIPGEKIRVSGGGRCNFTNRDAGPANFVSANPDFCRSALAQYSPDDFIALIRKHRIGFHEKHRGQLFCDRSSADVIDMLRDECAAGRVAWRLGVGVRGVEAIGHGFGVRLADGASVHARRVVVASGGLSIPKIGATDLGYRIARHFGLRIVEPRPGLVPLVCDPQTWRGFAALSGLAVPARVGWGRARQGIAFDEDLLFTHRGLSGPAALQISSYWQPGTAIHVDLLPQEDWNALVAAKGTYRAHAVNWLAERLPRRLAEVLGAQAVDTDHATRALADFPDRALRRLQGAVSAWEIIPSGTEGYRKAEVTVGGVDTRDLSSRTMEARQVPGLHFIGEVVDVTGWLGGYNFQWAWASAAACARSV
jgi:predicted Rossmann fold flavoprotein